MRRHITSLSFTSGTHVVEWGLEAGEPAGPKNPTPCWSRMPHACVPHAFWCQRSAQPLTAKAEYAPNFDSDWADTGAVPRRAETPWAQAPQRHPRKAWPGHRPQSDSLQKPWCKRSLWISEKKYLGQLPNPYFVFWHFFPTSVLFFPSATWTLTTQTMHYFSEPITEHYIQLLVLLCIIGSICLVSILMDHWIHFHRYDQLMTHQIWSFSSPRFDRGRRAMAGFFFSGLQGDGRKRVSFGLTSSFSSKSCCWNMSCIPKQWWQSQAHQDGITLASFLYPTGWPQ